MRFDEILAVLWLMAEDDEDLRKFLIMFVAQQSLTETLRVPNVVFDVKQLSAEESRHEMRFEPAEIMACRAPRPSSHHHVCPRGPDPPCGSCVHRPTASGVSVPMEDTHV